MAEVQIKEVRPVHEELMNMMLMHPGATLKELAAKLNLTVSWISIVANSDAFKARMAEKQKEIFGEVVVANVKERLESVASISLERLAEKVAVSDDERFLLDAAVASSKALGFGAPKVTQPAVILNQSFTATPEQLAAARQRIVPSIPVVTPQELEGKV